MRTTGHMVGIGGRGEPEDVVTSKSFPSSISALHRRNQVRIEQQHYIMLTCLLCPVLNTHHQPSIYFALIRQRQPNLDS